MAIFKCKMCGGSLEIQEGMTVCECEYCGSKQTIPTADNEKKMTLFGRANRLLRNCEFDKAEGIFESIVAEFPEEAEAYWGLVLCKYGIEYVDDPATGKKVPTCHRSSFDSVMDDSDFEQVMENSDTIARAVYREQAKQIEELRKGIIEVSGKEEAYDIFICYKETAEDGQRTIDSVLAQDVYDALTNKGYRVFFSRISLEDKLGMEYEPYIFAALNSAKVMLAFGTSYDYYNAVWVKNEWSRYLKLMAVDKNKYLIPCYKDIDAYDIPKEFSKLQAQDMRKVGAVQDLVRGIEKLFDKEEKVGDQNHQAVIQQLVSGGPTIDVLLKRGYDSLEDGAFDEAKTFFNDALNCNTESTEAYLGLFMADIKASNQATAQSKYISGNFTKNRYWKRANQYASGELAETLNTWDSLREARLQSEADAAQRHLWARLVAVLARLQSEADAAQRAKEEENRKLREEEEIRRKNEEEIMELQEQLYTGNFVMTAKEKEEQELLNATAKCAEMTANDAMNALSVSSEMQEVRRLESLISSKKIQIANLGFFKLKEKKELQEQINRFEETLAEAKKRVSQKQSDIDELKKKADDAAEQSDKYGCKLVNAKKKAVRERLFCLMGLDFSGKTVQFGSYEQGDGVKPIKWLVLEKTDDRILLMTQYGIDCKRYHETQTDVTWEKCDLRKWLNHDFLSIAFNEAEQNMIADTRCPADKNPKYKYRNPGNDTIDKVFLLSFTDVQKYLKSEDEKKVKPTQYARARGARQLYGYWWLRSPGRYNDFAGVIQYDGHVDFSGNPVHHSIVCVRPALWI